MMKSQTQRAVWLALILLLGCLVIYGQTCGFSYVHWDDHRHIFENPAFNPPSPGRVLGFWTAPYFGLYVPLSYTVWAMLAMFSQSAQAGPISAGLFHFSNLVLHGASTVLVFNLLRTLLREQRADYTARGQDVPLAREDWAAAIGAAAFAWHPVQVESVAWISGMRDLLSTFLCLLSIRFYLASVAARKPVPKAKGKQPAPSQAKRGMLNSPYAWATGFFVLALLSKPTAVVLPLILLTLNLGVLRRALRESVVELLPWFALCVPAVLITKSQQGDAMLEFVPPLWFRPWIALDSVAFYGWKLGFPKDLFINYGRSPKALLESGAWRWTWTVPVLLLAGAFLLRKRRPWLLAGLVVFLIGCFPVSGLVPFKFQDNSTVTDHYLYLSMFGVSLALAEVFRNLRNSWLEKGMIALLILGGARAALQTRVWSDSERLFRHSLAHHSPDVMVQNALGESLMREGKFNDAVEVFRKSLETGPDSFNAHNNLGAALMKAGKFEEGLGQYQISLRMKPDADTYSNLGVAFMEKNRFLEAAGEFRKALALDPRHARAREYLKYSLEQVGGK